MFNSGFPVPDGFVITSNAFDEFDDQTELSQELKEEILSSLRILGSDLVAVRSSATAEDGEVDSWAGQLDSFLNVKEEELFDKIKLCWEALSSTRALSYRKEKVSSEMKISVAVIIQMMVNAESAGVAFSIHPVTGDKDQLMIEAVSGLGESLVSGAITPDSYTVEKEQSKVSDIKISENKQILSNTQILELSDLVIKIENYYGFPCDIEWAYFDSKFYILQSRPVTTLIGKKYENEFDIEEYISRQDMVSMGRRQPSILEAKLKIIGWSANSKRELSAGYRIMVINSLGEQFGDKESRDKIDLYFDGKDMKFARDYIDKMATLNGRLLEEIPKNLDKDYLAELSLMFTYFRAIRWVIEGIYENVSSDDQKYIDEWRNSHTVFSSLDMYEKTHRQQDDKEWTLIGINGVLTYFKKIISCNVHSIDKNQREIKGKTGYPGIIIGKARVVLSDKERDSIKENEIIVAPMTTIDFMSVMKIASAFVTDEGGITCHAAIVAREMKKPCIMGTKIGTKVIKTGDMIEVDASKGVVRIIEER